MKFFFACSILFPFAGGAQNKLIWQNVDSLYQPLPSSVHVYFTQLPKNNSSTTTFYFDSLPFRAFYLIADLKDKQLEFTTDTTHKRRLTPQKFFEKNAQPLAVVNGTFFSFETNRNLNLVVKNKKLVSYNLTSYAARGKDTFTYWHPLASSIGIYKNRSADVAWTITDSSKRFPYALQQSIKAIHDSIRNPSIQSYKRQLPASTFSKWKVTTAIGGGPVLLQNGEIKITNNEERKFAGKAINDRHPRTAMGYTSDNKLIILVVEGRNTSAHGATLIQLAQVLKDLGCVEALNLDGGGSSCLLINGKETIKPSDKEGQRAVPAVFIIRDKKKN